jgi:hypothetical protein
VSEQSGAIESAVFAVLTHRARQTLPHTVTPRKIFLFASLFLSSSFLPEEEENFFHRRILRFAIMNFAITFLRANLRSEVEFEQSFAASKLPNLRNERCASFSSTPETRKIFAFSTPALGSFCG